MSISPPSLFILPATFIFAILSIWFFAPILDHSITIFLVSHCIFSCAVFFFFKCGSDCVCWCWYCCYWCCCCLWYWCWWFNSFFSLLIYFDARFIWMPQCAQTYRKHRHSTHFPSSILVLAFSFHLHGFFVVVVVLFCFCEWEPAIHQY